MDYERRLAISALLLEQVRMARAEYDAAGAHFTNVVKDVPSGLPDSDGALRMQLAGQDSRRTLRNYMDALRRFSDYTLREIVPEEYQKPD